MGEVCATKERRCPQMPARTPHREPGSDEYIRPALKFRFKASELYACVNIHRHRTQFKVNHNALVIDRIPMYAAQAAEAGKVNFTIRFPFEFMDNSMMHDILRNRMHECMPEEFEEALDHVNRKNCPTGWAIVPSYKAVYGKNPDAAFVAVWWEDRKRLVKEVTEVSWDEDLPTGIWPMKYAIAAAAGAGPLFAAAESAVTADSVAAPSAADHDAAASAAAAPTASTAQAPTA